jgi:dephospho-CoA kinase
MLVIGLTGGIGAGKSSVAGLFADLGWAVVDADQVARAVVAAGSPTLELLAETFGDRILDEHGALDRAALGQLVFTPPEAVTEAGTGPTARERLEAITHPAIAERSRERFDALASEGCSVALYEAALLIETGRHLEMDRLLVVVADEALRVARICQRDGLTERQARERLAAQWPQERKAALADHVIDNSGTLEETRRQVEQVWRLISEGGPGPSRGGS